jgi:ligand-binding SRPBCC domain-containing protein
MVDGPLKLWLHDYIFERDTAGEQVILINRIEFEPPGGLLGYIVTEEAIRDKLDDSFEHQRDVLQKKFAKPKI